MNPTDSNHVIDTPRRYDLNDDETRRRVFWLLQRSSSHALWKRKRDAFAQFAEAYENALETWPSDDPDAPPRHNLPIIREILAAYDHGLPRLAHGDRSVWRKTASLRVAIDIGI